jgi:DNA polymerase III delta subunit
MIYLFYGGDGERARGKWRKVIAAFATKHPSGEIFRFDAEHFAPAELEELALGAGLFGEKRLVAADRLLENKEAAAFFLDQLARLVASETVFVFLEATLSKEVATAAERAGAKLEAFAGEARDGVRAFNIFSLTDALSRRDRRELWLRFQEALAAGFSEEDIFWKFVWWVKSLLVFAKAEKPPAEMKPFVVQKNREALRHYQTTDLENLSEQLVALWHDARRGERDFELGLERLVLGI